MRRALREFGAILATAIVAAVVLVLIGQGGFLMLGRMGTAVYAAITSAAVIVAAGATWHFSRVWLRLPAISRRSAIAIAAVYAVTWVMGVPAAHTDFARSEVAIYKRLKAEGDGRVWDAHPRIEFFASFPVAPAIVLTYHEYQVAGLWGEGRWDLTAWYIGGVYPLVGMGTWIS